MKIEISEL